MNITLIIISILLVVEVVGLIWVCYSFTRHLKQVFDTDCEESTTKIIDEIWNSIDKNKEQTNSKED